MATITLKGNTIHTLGNLPQIGQQAPDFTLVKNDLSTTQLSNYQGQKVVLNIFPNIDTGVCATSVRKFNEEAASLQNTKVLCISKDLPFAQARFCAAEGIENVENLSDFRTGSFGKDFGIEIIDGPLAGLHARAVVVLDETGKVTYTELVPEIGQEPDYQSAINSL